MDCLNFQEAVSSAALRVSSVSDSGGASARSDICDGVSSPRFLLRRCTPVPMTSLTSEMVTNAVSST